MSASALPSAASLPDTAPAADSVSESERLDAAADQAIAACGGDLRSAIRALILVNEYLEHELCEMFAAVSRGYARGRMMPRRRHDRAPALTASDLGGEIAKSRSDTRD